MKTKAQVQAMHRKQIADWLKSENGAMAMMFPSEIEHETVSLEEIGLEENSTITVFGGFSESAIHASGSIFEYMEWFYEEESCYEMCN